MDFFSHTDPYVKLRDHLYQVAVHSQEVIDKSPVANCDRGFLSSISALIGIGHDYGKYTSYFQNYLLKQERSARLHEHSFISAFFTAYMIQRWLHQRQNKHWGDEKQPVLHWLEFAPLIGYFVVLHHHGHLRAVKQDVISYGDYEDDFLPDHLQQRLDIMKQQLKDQSRLVSSIESEYRTILKTIDCKDLDTDEVISLFIVDWENVLTMLDDLYHGKFNYERDVSLKQQIYQYTLLLYSALIDADKHAAAQIKRSLRQVIPPNLVDQYRDIHFDTQTSQGINGWRNKIYDTVMNRIAHLEKEITRHHLFTLTAPTGTGKTLLSFSVALKWRQIISTQLGYMPRIIYSLPFTSVIDQNEKVLRDVLSLLPDFKTHENQYLLKHHHLSNIRYKREGEERPLKEALLLMESWESEVVITTFVQLFQTLIGHRNRSLKKFHQLIGSIIILDEVQNLPIEYWPLIRWTLRALSDVFQCKILLLTATQPLIFEEGEALELLQGEQINPTDFFVQQNRVQLGVLSHGERSDFEIEEWIDHFKAYFDEGLNYLAIFNTIKTSVKVFHEIKNWIDDQGLEYKVFYLSTNIIPRERKRRIQQIKQHLNKGKRVIVISTQVVEAGVDLDFDVVYRDLGPVDSIIQAAGRCNRNGDSKKMGQVWISPIRRGEQLESSLVYRKLHTVVSKQVLPQDPVSESDFFHLVNRYFTELVKGKETDESKAIWQAMNELYFDRMDSSTKSAVSDFKLIQEKSHYIDVFVEGDGKGKKIWELYQVLVVNEADIETRYENYLRLKRLLCQYIVSAPHRIVKGLWDEEQVLSNKGLLYLPKHLLPQYYDPDTGVKHSPQEADAWLM